jgi:hypothetical protein
VTQGFLSVSSIKPFPPVLLPHPNPLLSAATAIPVSVTEISMQTAVVKAAAYFFHDKFIFVPPQKKKAIPSQEKNSGIKI